MPNPRKPVAVAEATGATVSHPGRHKDRSKPKAGKIGNPYKRLSDEETAYWHQYVGEFPWLVSSDRQQLRILCQLSAQYDEQGAEFPFNKLNMIRQVLNSFGGSPADRSKVHGVPEEEEEDPAKEFLN